MLIPLTRNAFAEIDDEDFELVSRFKWRLQKRNPIATGYAVAGRNKIIYMHRLIINAPLDKEIDHIDRNSLNNHKNNLRPATRSQNVANSNNPKKKYKGVYKYSKNRFRAMIWNGSKQIIIGSFKVEEDAAKAYNEAAHRIYGEFAYVNPV